MDQLTLSFRFLLTLHLLASGVASTTFTLVNKCDYTVWPGILSNAGVASLSTTGFVLQSGESKTITAPTSWGGRFWGRTLCTQNVSTGRFSCVTGDCASGKLECAGNGATPPATLAEFTLNGAGGLDFFDVSLVDGYNVPMLVVPQGGSGDNCTATGCVGDLNGPCPSELRVTSVDGKQSVACKSACEAFGSPQYCCSGAYGSPNTCKPSAYSLMFKNACPRAYSYAYDDKTSTFTCGSDAAYAITFCPSANSNPSQKSWQGQNPKPDGSGSGSSSASASPQLNNGTMVYVGAMDESGIPWSAGTHVWESNAIASIVSITVAIWLLCQLY
ncbi:thaumatin-like protein 1 [Abrus precatorius]|uniref:Thaumatin-like protein 1 n=1 Tax=Abrus precatorius TaxID=3816 RepID=A0A8B8LE29_ABRPR|nr:thaumatin-like protein 1 [Abrus precatorius]